MFTEWKTFLYKHLKWAAIKCQQAQLITPSVIYVVMSPPWGVQLHISAAKEAGDVTGLTSKIQKSPNRYQKGSFVMTVHLHLQLYPS